MATLTIRNLPEETLAQFRVRAAEKGRSMEAEARALIVEAVDKPLGYAVAELRPVDPEIRARVEAAQAKVREMFGGELPKGRVDAFLRERRAAAARGE
jgi:plasmid stability protein